MHHHSPPNPCPTWGVIGIYPQELTLIAPASPATAIALSSALSYKDIFTLTQVLPRDFVGINSPSAIV